MPSGTTIASLTYGDAIHITQLFRGCMKKALCKEQPTLQYERVRERFFPNGLSTEQSSQRSFFVQVMFQLP